MKPAEFDQYLREYTAQGVGPLLYALILGVVRDVIQHYHYPAKVYSPNQVWDEDAITGLCHDFTAEKLLKAGWLEYHLLTQVTHEGLEGVLKRDFRHFLISRKTRSEYTNLYERVRKILAEDSRFSKRDGGKSIQLASWGLADWGSKDVAQYRDEVLEAMFAVELPPLVRYRADSKKHSHLLSSDQLSRFLEGTLRKLNKYVSLTLLMDGLRYRLNLLEVEGVSLNESTGTEHELDHMTYADLIPDSADVYREVNAKEIATDLFERLSDRQRHILAMFSSLAHPTLAEIGTRVHASKSTVNNEINAIKKSIAAFDIASDEVEKVFSYVLEMCMRSLEKTDDYAE